MEIQEVSRRNFLKSGAFGAALMNASSYRRISGANERVRVGFIGIGLIGKRHLLDFQDQPDVEVAGICEVYEPRLREGIEISGKNANGFTDFRRMLDQKDIDAVVISTPDHWHALLTIMSCAAGKDVYVEKPLTLFVKEGRWMIAAARRYGRVVQVGTQQRSGTPFQKCRDLVRQGHIGDLRSVRITSYRNVLPGFTAPVGTQPLSVEQWNLWLGPAPYVAFDPNRCIYHFRWYWDYSGGQTTNLLAHEIDIVQWVTKGLPHSVAAVGQRFSLKGIGETPDVFEAIFSYPGFIVNWSYRELAGRSNGCRGGTEYVGTRGSLIVNRSGIEVFPDTEIPSNDQIPQFTTARHKASGPPKLRTTPVRFDGYEQVKDQFGPHVRNFVDCVKSRMQPVSDLESGHRTVVSCHLANIAMKLGRSVQWDWEKEEVPGDREANELLIRPYRSPWDKELMAVLPNIGEV